MDVTAGTLNIAGGALTIGQPGYGGLSYNYLGTGALTSNSVYGYINSNGSTYTVSLNGASDTFLLSGSTFTDTAGMGTSLAAVSGGFTYTAPDGSVAQFATQTNILAPFPANQAVVTSVTKPSGEVLSYAYDYASFCGGNGQNGCAMWVPTARLMSVTSSHGYQLHFSYATDSTASQSYIQLSQVVAINTTVVSCAPTADGCSLPANTWPTLTYSNNGNAVTDSAGRVTTLAVGSTTVLTKPSGSTITQTSTGATSFTLSNGVGTWTYSWSTSSGVVTMVVTDPLGHTRTVVSSGGEITSDTDALGHTISYAYGANGLLSQVTTSEGVVTQYVYDNGVSGGRGNITQTTTIPKSGSGLSNIVTSASYTANPCSNLLVCNLPNSTTDALGHTTSYTYSPVHGGVLTMTAPAGANGIQPVTAYSYSQVSTSVGGLIWQPTQIETCATSTATITATSTSAGLSCSAGASDLIINSVSYSGSNNGLPTSSTTAAGDGSLSASTQTTYNNLGDPLTVRGPLGASQTVNYVYDAIRRPIGVISPNPQYGSLLPRAVSTTYSADGLPTAIAQGTVNTSLTWSSFTALSTENISYDSIDRKITDALYANGATQSLTQYTYDAANRLTCTAVRMNASVFTSLPASACTLGTQGSNGPDLISSNTYDPDNRITQVTDGYGTAQQRNSVTTTYSPDGNRLTDADGKGNLTTYAYDGFNRKSTIYYPTPSNGSVSSTTDYEQLSYDADSRPTQDRRRDGQVVVIGYDNLSRATSVSLPASTYAYDNLGRLTNATRTDLSQSLSYTHDALGRQTSESGAYGVFGYQFDLAGDLTRITWPDGFYAQYVYDWAGDLTQIEENGATSGAGVLASYGYNNLGQRTSITRGDNVTTTYSYDSAWRLHSLAHAFPTTSNNQTITLAYSPASQISSRISSNPTYNWTGSSAITRAYTVNGQNQLTQSGSYAISYDGRGNLSSDSVNSYGYDVNNHLTSFNSSATLATDPVGRLMEVTDLSGGVAQTSSRWFRYGGSQLLAEYGMVGSDNGVLHDRYVPGPGTDETVVSYPGSSTATRYWSVTDERGSVIALADNNGAPYVINTYDDYGVPAATNGGRFQYTGQMWISEAGLYHYKARNYSPTLGRFLQTDPIGYGDGMNWYNYAHGNPINLTDSSGMADLPPGCANTGPCETNGNGGCPSGEVPLDTGGCGVPVTGRRPPQPTPPPVTCDSNGNCVGQPSAPVPPPQAPGGQQGRGGGQPAPQNNPKPCTPSTIAGWYQAVLRQVPDKPEAKWAPQGLSVQNIGNTAVSIYAGLATFGATKVGGLSPARSLVAGTAGSAATGLFLTPFTPDPSYSDQKPDGSKGKTCPAK